MLLLHTISKRPLITFWTKHPTAKAPLEAWYKTVENSNFADFNELRKTFSTADYVRPLTVFNISGNRFRLIAAIHYNTHKIYIRNILTHAEYTLGKWKEKKS